MVGGRASLSALRVTLGMMPSNQPVIRRRCAEVGHRPRRHGRGECAVGITGRVDQRFPEESGDAIGR